jgi:hypothetical protein
MNPNFQTTQCWRLALKKNQLKKTQKNNMSQLGLTSETHETGIIS